MSKPKTHVSIILDRSGSMYGTREQTVMGYNEQVEQIQLDAKDQDILVSLITFNGYIYEHFWCESPEKLQKSSAEDYQPTGSTALNDALGYTIDKLQKTTQEDENTSYLLIVITDGEENASKQYTNGAELKHKIESLQKDKNWTFTFMGCNQDSLFKLAKETGIPVSNCALWDNSQGVNTYKGMAENKKKLGEFFNARRRGERKSAKYHSAEAHCCADYSQVDDKDALLFQYASGVQNLQAAAPAASQLVNNATCSVSAGTGVFSTKDRAVNLKEFYVQS